MAFNEGKRTIIIGNESDPISIPVDSDILGEFLKGLLGRPQIIRKAFNIQFALDQQKISDIDASLRQRASQNKAMSFDFEANIFYDDKTSIRVGSLEELFTLRVFRQVRVTSLLLQWSFLINFGKEIPEKQEVEIFFMASKNRKPSAVALAINPFLRPMISELRKDKENIVFRIAHTERSWGEDINNLLSNLLESYAVGTTGWKDLLYRFSGKISWLVGLTVYVTLSFSMFHALDKFMSVINGDIAALQGQSVDKKIDYALRIIVDAPSSKALLFGVGSIISFAFAAIALQGFLSRILFVNKNSFILLTQRDNDQYALEEKTYRQAPIHYVFSAVSSVIAAAISRYLIPFIVEALRHHG